MNAVKASTSERNTPELPKSEEAAVALALSNSKDLRRLESVLTARGYAVKAQRASRLPQIDLVAQYSLLTRYNFNEDFFGQFNRHAGQLGVSVQLPLLSGTGATALAQQAEIDSSRLRTEIKSARGRISLDARRSFAELRNVEAAEEVARLDLEVRREALLCADERAARSRDLLELLDGLSERLDRSLHRRLDEVGRDRLEPRGGIARSVRGDVDGGAIAPGAELLLDLEAVLFIRSRGVVAPGEVDLRVRDDQRREV